MGYEHKNVSLLFRGTHERVLSSSTTTAHQNVDAEKLYMDAALRN